MEKNILFEDLNISKEIKKALRDMDFVEATPVQSQSIPYVLEGRDVVAQAPTGTGKTCSFGIPIIEKTGPGERAVGSLILCPTRELVVQTTNELLKLTKYKKHVRVVAIYGGQNIERQISALKKKPQIIVATPGRLMDHMKRHTIRLDKLRHVVLDEADEMLDMGFRDDIDRILESVPVQRQTVLFSATMSKEILSITRKYLHNPAKVQITKSVVTVKSVKQYYLEVSQFQKTDILARLIDLNDFKLSIVFCNTKKKVDELAYEMIARGYNAVGLHGDMKQTQRDRVMKAFKTGKVEILIATDVAARGIDIKDVDVVFNYDLPDDLEYYVHRIGRTGRANRDGVSYSLVTRREMYKLHEIMKYTKAKIKFKTLPNVVETTNVKLQQTMASVTDTIVHNDLKFYADSIQKFIEDSGDEYTILDVAAAFLKNVSGVEPEEEAVDNKKTKRRAVPSKSDRIFVNLGKMDAMSPAAFRKILNDCGLRDEEIYGIDILEKFSFVEVDKSGTREVLTSLNGSVINGRRVNAELSFGKRK